MFWVIFILNHFCVVLLLMCNFQCVLLVDSNCTNLLVCLSSIFFLFRLPLSFFFDAGVVVPESVKYSWSSV